MYFYCGLRAQGKLRVLSQLLEPVHHIFIRIHFVKIHVEIEARDLVWTETKSHGHCLVSLKETTFIFRVKSQHNGRVSSSSRLHLGRLQQKARV